MEIGEYIKKLREKRGYTQRQLSYLSKISNTEISRIESGKRKNPSPEILKKLAPHLGVPYEDLMRAANYLKPSNPALEEKILTILANNPHLLEFLQVLNQQDISLLEKIKNLPEKDRKLLETIIDHMERKDEDAAEMGK